MCCCTNNTTLYYWIMNFTSKICANFGRNKVDLISVVLWQNILSPHLTIIHITNHVYDFLKHIVVISVWLKNNPTGNMLEKFRKSVTFSLFNFCKKNLARNTPKFIKCFRSFKTNGSESLNYYARTEWFRDDLFLHTN